MVSIGLQGFCTGTAPETVELHRLYFKPKQGKATRYFCPEGKSLAIIPQ
jgi:hypothetical protein